MPALGEVRCEPARGEGGETGEHPGRARIPGVMAQGLAWLAFRNSAQEGTETVALGFEFERSPRMVRELHVRGSDGRSRCIPI
jgi:hypothetical protein